MATRNSPHLRLTPQAGRRIRIYRNGDAHHKGITIVMNARQVHDINAFLDAVNEKIGLVLGAKRLFTLDGMPVKSTEQLEHNKEYVAASGPFTPLPYGQQQSSAAFRPSPVAMARRGSSSAIGSRFSRPSEEDAFALSSASKKSAPASLAHPALRQSRSTEPRKGQQRIVSSTVANNRPKRDKSTDGSKETKKKGIAVKGVPAAGESKKRGKKKAREEDKLVGSPPTPPPVHLPVDEPKGEEAEEEEESPIRGSPIERTRTEVEVVGHDEPAEEQQEEEEEAEEVAEVEEGEVEEKHVEEEEEEAENDEKGEEAEAKEEHEEKAKEEEAESGEETGEEEKEGEQHHEHHNHRKSVEELEAAEQHHNPTN